MTTYNVRCTIHRKCGKAMTLRHHPDQYKVYPMCPICKVGFLNEIPHAKIQTQERTCRCHGISWPHKKGLYLNKDEFCDHSLVDLDFEGSRVFIMKPTDPVPF